MVVLAASICTKGGKPVISRQFRELSRARLESLLASFPKLIPTNTQHTSVETADVRYVYQPLEDLYILLVTNKASNILQDIETLHLFARVVSDLCRSADEREIHRQSFELLSAFDEIVSLGYRENMNLMQVRNVLEMESHEEKIQEIIARNKEAEAKEELKRRAKQLEMQRREQQRRAATAGGGSGYLGSGGNMSSYSPAPRFESSPSITPARTASPAPSTLKAPAFKSSGMRLGSKKAKQADLLDAMGAEAAEDTALLSTPTASEHDGGTLAATSAAAAAATKAAHSSLPIVDPESVHVLIRETLSLSLMREGGIKSLELKGDMNLHISDPAVARVRLALAPSPNDYGSDLQFKAHPNVGKLAPSGEKAIALKDASRGFPVGQPLAVLKWRMTGKDESYVPLSINCWPTPSNDGTCDVNIEYELENENLTLYDVVISIPLPAGSYPTVASHTGEWALNPSNHSLDWSIATITADERSGSLEFSVGGDDAGAFFPVKVAFVAQGSLVGVGINGVSKVDGGDAVEFSQDASVAAEDYIVL